MFNSSKSRKIVILIPVIILVVIAIIIGIVFLIINLSKSNEELFWEYFSQVEDITKIFMNDKIIEQENFKKTNSYTANGNIEFVLAQGENSYKQFNVLTTSRHDANTNRTYSDIILKNGELDLYKVSYANTGNIYAIKCDDFFGSYVGIQNSNLTELAEKYGIENVPNSIDTNEYINLFELNDVQKQHLADTYLPIIMQHIAPEQYIKESENIEINGINYSTNSYKIEVSSNTLYEILTDCFNILKTDTETLTLMSDKLSRLGYGTEYSNVTNITSKIDEFIENLQINDNLTIIVYENDDNNIRTSIINGSKVNITYDRLGNSNILSMDVSYQANMENMNNEEIIDLSAVAENSSTTARFIINKTINEDNSTNNIQIIPNIRNSDEYINVSINLGDLQNDTIANEYNITINKIENEKKSSITTNYNNNIAKVDTVQEIEELTGSNTAIANYYAQEQFSTFIKTWTNIFIDKLSEKMNTLGVEEVADELEKINVE